MPTIVEGISQEARESIVRYVRYKSADEQHRISLGGNDYDCKNLIKWIVLEGVFVGRFVATIDSSVVDTLRYLQDQRVVQVMLSTITHQLDTTGSGTHVSLLSSTSQGDITSLFNVFIDRFIGPCYMGPYEVLIQLIGVPSKDVLLVTANSIEDLSAAKAGLMVAKVREHPQRWIFRTDWP